MDFWRIIKLARPIWGWMALAMLLGCITIASGIGLMTTSAYLISAAALHPSIAALSIPIVGVRFFGLARGVFRYLERLVSHHAALSLLARFRVWLYDALEPLAPARLLSYAYGKGVSSGDLLSRVIADIDILQDVYVRVLAPPLVAALVGVGMWWLFGAFDLRFVLLFIAFYLLAGVGVPLLTGYLGRRASREWVRARAELRVRTIENIQGMADVLAFGQEQRQVSEMSEVHGRLVRSQMRTAQINGLQSLLSNLLLNLAILSMLLGAIPLVQAGQLNGVYLALLVLAVPAGFEAVLPLPSALQQLGGTMEAARRIFAIVDAEPLVPAINASTPLPESYDITIQHLNFRYQPEQALILRDLSLSIPVGKCVALVGASGAGKSSVAHLLQRFWDYEEGSIRIGGQELRSYTPEDVSKFVSVVAQDTHLFNTTIKENLRLAKPDASDDEIIKAARQAQIDDIIQALPYGYDTRIGEQGLLLSGGERQRLAIARAILKDAPILLLDEPTANLDAVSEYAVSRNLRELMRERTALLITHRLVDLEHADEILYLDDGRVIERGTHYELMQLEGRYWHIWRSQHEVLI